MTADELRALVNEATPGPWEALHDNGTVWASGFCIAADQFHHARQADARLIALAPLLASLFADAMEALRLQHTPECGAGYCGNDLEHCERWRSLRDSFAALGETA